MNFFFRKTRIINYNFDFNYSDNSFSEKIQSYILRKIIKKAVISVTLHQIDQIFIKKNII